MASLARVFAAGSIAVAVASASGVASASQLIDRNAQDVRLHVSRSGVAVLTYRVGNRFRRVVARGAVNAIAPTTARPQVRFKLDYSGGSRQFARAFRDACRPYDGPQLDWLVTACKAPDGSYWAVQSWQRALPNFGVRPGGSQAAWELRLSHWRGALPALSIELDWAYGGRFDHLFGTYVYNGSPVYGFRNTRFGAPLDTFGRNVYVDTFNSAYGFGWHRENSFLTHRPTGIFCYGFYPHGRRPSGRGQYYRATVIGPGVTPDVTWKGAAPGPYDPDRDRLRNATQAEYGSSKCRPN